MSAAMATIDPTARIETGAKIGQNVSIGPYCTVGAHVVIGDGCRLIAHVHLAGHCTIGPRTVIYPFASLGSPPQSVNYRGGATRLSVGADCDIREGVTMSIGTERGGGLTEVGDRGFYMAYSHVGHDCRVGDDVVFANCATLGGHCEIGDRAFLGGLCAIHQFVRVGEQAMIGGLVGVTRDVIPFGVVIGHRGELAGLNVVGLKRQGWSHAKILGLRRAYGRLFFGEGTLTQRVNEVANAFADDANVMRIVKFIRSVGKRHLTMPRESHGED
jgi:UDP-N-acetylglucosamine acyltransferase